MLKLVKITENTWRLKMSSVLLKQKPYRGSIKICKMRFTRKVKKQSQGLFLWSLFSRWHVISLFNVLINVNLQSTYLLEWNSLVLPRFRPFLPSRMGMGLGLHCISSSILCLVAQTANFNWVDFIWAKNWLLSANFQILFSTEQILVELWCHVYQNEYNVDQNESCLVAYSFTIRHILLLLDTVFQTCYMLRTYMMFYMSVPPPFCFCSPKGTIMKIRSILTCIMLSLPQYLIVKLLDAYIVFL